MTEEQVKIARLEGELNSRRWMVESLRDWCLLMSGGDNQPEIGQEGFRPDAAQSEILGQVVVRLNHILKGWGTR